MHRQFKLLKSEDLTNDLWANYTQLRDASADYDDPLFDPHWAKLTAELREDVRFGLVFERDQLAGVWPLHVRPGNWSRPIGGPFSDWHAPILKSDTDLQYREFLSGLGLSGMTVFGLAPDRNATQTKLKRVGANVADISMGAEAFLENQQKMWPKHFKKMRRLYRNVERDFESSELIFGDQRRSSFDSVLAQKSEQYRRTGYHDILSVEWIKKFLDRLWEIEAPRLRLRLIRLEYDGQHAASELNIESDTVLHGWLTVYNQDFSNYSPGNMLVHSALEYMERAGIKYYDCGPGLDHYKRHYANCQYPVESGILIGKSTHSPSRLAADAWRWCERKSPDKIAHLLARGRRRMDQILISETEFGGRVRGVYSALSRRDV